jgi:ribosomal protein S27AE
LKNGASVSNLINLTCPSCGGKLQITNDVERFSCGFCGNEQIVQRIGGVITLSPVVEGLKDVKTGVDKTASELAIARLEREINDLIQKRDKDDLPNGKNSVFGFLVIGAIYCLYMWWSYNGILQEKANNYLGVGVVLAVISIIFLAITSRGTQSTRSYFDKLIAEKTVRGR